METVQSLIAYIESLSGHPLNADEGVHLGSPEAAVRRVLVCWMATGDALTDAVAQGCDLVLCHESLYYPYGALPGEGAPPAWWDWPTNQLRRGLLQEHGMTLLRVHGSLDEICIYDEFAALLDLGRPVQAEGLARVYEIAPCELCALVDHVKERVGLRLVRVSAPYGMEQVVRRVGLPWGGLGLFVNVGYQQRLIAMDCDVLIGGESDDYGLRFAAELGIPFIETGHSVSENPGLRQFARMLAARFPDVEVLFHECPPAWQVV